MKETTKALLLVGGLVAAIPVIVYAATSLRSVQTTITVTLPPAEITQVSMGGVACSQSASIYSCSGNLAEGASGSIIITLSNPGSQSETVASTTTIPPACGITATDNSLTLAGGMTGSITIGLQVAGGAPIGGCSITTQVIQA